MLPIDNLLEVTGAAGQVVPYLGYVEITIETDMTHDMRYSEDGFFFHPDDFPSSASDATAVECSDPEDDDSSQSELTIPCTWISTSSAP